MRERRISYEKARILARYADAATLDQWIDDAARLTCVALRRELEDQEEAQMCARGNFEVVVPESMRSLLAMAFHAVRDAAKEWLSPGECLARIAEHFIEVYKPMLNRRKATQHDHVLRRDRGRCQVPGCSRAAGHSHHIKFRSHGGSDDDWNCVALCAAHHLQCIHNGWVRVRGTAPDDLYWELGVRPGFPPLAVFAPVAAG
jgi:hypothetical protein